MNALARNRRGSALLLTTVLIVAMTGIAAAFFSLIATEGRVQHSQNMANDSRYVIEAAVTRALEELRTGLDYDGDGTVGTVAGSFNGASYEVVLQDPDDGTYILYAAAEKSGVRRAVEVVVTSSADIPAPGFGAQAALALLGKMDKKAKIDLHLKKPHHHGKDKDGDDVDDDDEEEPWTSESLSPVAVDGTDAAGLKPDLPAVGIEDPTAYAKITDKIAHRMFHGKIPYDAFLGDPGDPPHTISTKKHGGFETEASIAPLLTGPSSLSYENMNVIHDQIEAYVDDVLIPKADIVLWGKDVRIRKDTTWGTPHDPQVVLLDANKLKIENGVTVKGYGTLIVQGDVDIHKDAVLEWDGEIIVLGKDKRRHGKKRNASLKNKHGEMTVDGMVLVLAGGSEKGKAKLDLHNDAGTHDSSTVINGALLVWSGNSTKHKDKAEAKFKHGDFEINGFIGIYGDKTKFDAKIGHKHHGHHDRGHKKHEHRHRDGSFVVHGGVVVAVPGTDGKHKAKVHLHGDDILIQYHSTYVEGAIERLMQFGDQIPGKPFESVYKIVSWRGIPVPAGMLEAGDAYGQQADTVAAAP